MKKINSNLCRLCLLLLVFASTNTVNAQDYKNEIRFAAVGGIDNVGFELQYVRDLNEQFAVLATLGYHKVDSELEEFSCGEFQSHYSRLGLGAEWRAKGQPKGFFVQANILIRILSDEYSARIFREMQTEENCSFGILDIFNFDSNDLYSERVEYQSFGFSGKTGYRLMTKNERFTFAPFVKFETSPTKQTDTTLPLSEFLFSSSNDPEPSIVVNAHQESKKMQLQLGIELGVRF